MLETNLPRRIRERLAAIPMFWRIQVLAWLSFGVLAMPLKAAAFGSGEYALLITLYREPLGFAVTLLFRLIYRRLDIGLNRPAHLAVWVVGLSLVAGAVDALLGEWITRLIHPARLGQGAFGIFCVRGLLYCAWSFLYFWIRDQIAASARLLDLARAETAARDAELLMLRAQVSPHFLFNALNTVLAGLDRQPASLAPMVQGLADYFRYSLTSRHDDMVPLGEEFDAIMNYLMVEKARFRDSLVVESHIDPICRARPVPGVFLQPLVENGLKYGYETSRTPLRLRVRVEAADDGGVEVEVANSGSWIEPSSRKVVDDAHGNGLTILKRRLELLYQKQHSIHISNNTEGDEVIVRIHLPPLRP